MFFESKKHTLAPRKVFLKRLLKYLFYSLLFLIFSLGLGAVGYAYFAQLSWVDAFLNASMILTGMGPVNPMKTNIAKIFAAVYALYSGIAFLSTVAVIFTPIVHRILHIFHLENTEDT